MNIVYKSTEGLKGAWKKACGAYWGICHSACGLSMLEKRNIKPNNKLLDRGLMSGFGFGWVPGLLATVLIVDNTGAVGIPIGLVAGIATWFTLTMTVFPAVLHLPYALYKAGEHDEKLRLANKGKQAAALPKPELTMT